MLKNKKFMEIVATRGVAGWLFHPPSLTLYLIFIFIMKMTCANSSLHHTNLAWPDIMFKNTLTQMRASICMWVMVVLDWWASRFRVGIFQPSSTHVWLYTILGYLMTCIAYINCVMYLSYGGPQESIKFIKGLRHWTTPLEDASDIPEVIDGSNSSDGAINTVIQKSKWRVRER